MADRSLYLSIKNAALKYPDNNALLFMGKYIKYTDLIIHIDQVSSGLQALGIKPKSVVTIAMPNIFEAVYAFYAVNKLGAICHMVHPLTPVKQMERFMKSTNSHHLIIIDTFYEHYKDILADKQITMVLASPVRSFGFIKKIAYKLINKNRLNSIDKTNDNIIAFSELFSQDYVMEPFEVNAKDTSVYLHSGGTSGEPKTIELSSFAINSLGKKLPFILGMENYKDFHMLGVLPMFHGFGLCMGIHALLMVGGVDTLMPKFDAAKTTKLIKNNQINCIIGVPSLFESLLSQPGFAGAHLFKLKHAYVGGDYVALDLLNRFDKVMTDNFSQAKLLEGYGLTEVVSVCAVNTLSEHLPMSVGKPLPGIDIQIVDVESRAFLDNDMQGEIVVSGGTMMNGYLMDKKATKAAFLTDDSKKKWILTGDYGFIDSFGYLHFKQRLKRIIKVYGIPVMPSEIENLLMSLDEIKEVAAIGITDQEKGSVIKLFLVLNKEIERKYDDEGYINLIKTEISNYAIPKEIVYLDVLPKTIIGKIDTTKLEAEY